MSPPRPPHGWRAGSVLLTAAALAAARGSEPEPLPVAERHVYVFVLEDSREDAPRDEAYTVAMQDVIERLMVRLDTTYLRLEQADSVRDARRACRQYGSCDVVIIDQFEGGSNRTRFKFTLSSVRRRTNVENHPLEEPPRDCPKSNNEDWWGKCRRDQATPLAMWLNSRDIIRHHPR